MLYLILQLKSSIYLPNVSMYYHSLLFRTGSVPPGPGQGTSSAHNLCLAGSSRALAGRDRQCLCILHCLTGLLSRSAGHIAGILQPVHFAAVVRYGCFILLVCSGLCSDSHIFVLSKSYPVYIVSFRDHSLTFSIFIHL